MFIKLENFVNFLFKNLFLSLNFLYLYEINFFNRTIAQSHNRTIALLVLFLLFSTISTLYSQNLASPTIVGFVDKVYSLTPLGLNNVNVEIQPTGGNVPVTMLTKTWTSFPGLPSGAAGNVFLNKPGVFFNAFPLVNPIANPAIITEFSVTLSRTDWPSNGVSSADMIAMQDHILSVKPFQNPWQKIAADVNLSGTVSTADMVMVRKVILGWLPGFTDVDSWVFVDRTQMWKFIGYAADLVTKIYVPTPLGNQYGTEPFSITGYPWSILGDSKHPVTPKAVIPAATPITKEYDAYKMGHCDLNILPIALQSKNNNALAVNESSTREQSISVEQHNTILKGQVFKLNFSISPQNNVLSAFQFATKFNPNLIEFINIENAEIDDYTNENIGLVSIDNGEIRSLWVKGDGKIEQINDDKNIFSITFKAKEKIENLANVINLANDIIPTEFIDNLNQECNSIINVKLEESIGISRSKVFPTVFDNTLTLEITVLNRESIDFQIFSIDGRLAYSKQTNLNKGYNTATFDGLNNLQNGTYCYVLKSESGKILDKGLISK